ncbi:hypothetical protein ACWPMX_11985 [Tsuneonella sp. HG094]
MATIAATLVAAPIAVHAAPVARASAPTSEEGSLGGGGEWANALIIIAIAVAGMLALILSDDDDSPVSP